MSQCFPVRSLTPPNIQEVNPTGSLVRIAVVPEDEDGEDEDGEDGEDEDEDGEDGEDEDGEDEDGDLGTGE